MNKIKGMLSIITITVIGIASISLTAFAMPTEEFDNNIQYAIDAYNAGEYQKAQTEFQNFCDENWDDLNEGQQQYIQDYLDGIEKQKYKKSPLTTEEFDEGMKKGIDYFQREMYTEAKDEFQWFSNAKWNNMNEGQRQYLTDYLNSAREKASENVTKNNNSSNIVRITPSKPSISTKNFDLGMAKGISYFKQGKYIDAMLEFQTFCDKNWGKMNEGQQKYALDYLGSAKARVNWKDFEKWVDTKLKLSNAYSKAMVRQVDNAHSKLEEFMKLRERGSLIAKGYFN